MPAFQQQPADILVVDDVPANLQLLCRILKERGHKARPVPNGELALQAAATSPPDLVLLDIDMPGMNGFELCQRLKSNPALADIPVIFVSAMTDIRDVLRGFSVGAVDYVTKPFRFEEVNARVETHLELRRQRHALQVAYDRLRELEKLRDSLVHMLVHDLRSPLTVMTGSLELLAMDNTLSESHHRDAEDALGSAWRMVVMVNAVLDLNQLETSKIPLQRADTNIVALAREVVGTLSSLAGSATVQVRASSETLTVSLDRGLIARVLQNLVANALKYIPETGGEVQIRVDHDSGTTRVRVQDNGPGVAIEHHKLIFEKFGRVSASNPRDVPSTGLGLPFCKLAVEAHGGQIGVESTPGKGASFWFEIPG